MTDELEANNTTSDSDEQANELITGVSEDTPTTTGGSDTAAKHDYPRRPGLRKLTRQQPAPVPVAQPPPQKVRAQRHNSGKQPQRFVHLAEQTVELEN